MGGTQVSIRHNILFFRAEKRLLCTIIQQKLKHLIKNKLCKHEKILELHFLLYFWCGASLRGRFPSLPQDFTVYNSALAPPQSFSTVRDTGFEIHSLLYERKLI